MVAVSTTAGAEPGSSSVEQATIVQAEAGNSCVGDSGTLFWSRPNVEGLTSYTVEHWAYSPVPSVLVTEVGAEQTSVLFTFRFGLNISWLCRQSAGAEALREPGMCRHRELNPLFGSHERPRKGSTSPPRTRSRLRVLEDGTRLRVGGQLWLPRSTGQGNEPELDAARHGGRRQCRSGLRLSDLRARGNLGNRARQHTVVLRHEDPRDDGAAFRRAQGPANPVPPGMSVG